MSYFEILYNSELIASLLVGSPVLLIYVTPWPSLSSVLIALVHETASSVGSKDTFRPRAGLASLSPDGDLQAAKINRRI